MSGDINDYLSSKLKDREARRNDDLRKKQEALDAAIKLDTEKRDFLRNFVTPIIRDYQNNLDANGFDLQAKAVATDEKIDGIIMQLHERRSNDTKEARAAGKSFAPAASSGRYMLKIKYEFGLFTDFERSPYVNAPTNSNLPQKRVGSPEKYKAYTDIDRDLIDKAVRAMIDEVTR